MKNIIILCVLVMVAITSCGREKKHSIPDEFVPFINTFFEEANKRNVFISLDDFELTVRFVDDEDHAGVCNFTDSEIRIDKTAWQTSSYQRKEWIIFHELGHCILNRREHNNNKTDTEECLSIMNEKLSGSRCAINLHSTVWRKYYLDELFTETEALPDWYNDHRSYNDNFNRNYQIDTTITASDFNNTIDFNLDNNFVIEMEFFDYSDRADVVNLSWDNNIFSFCKSCTKCELEFNNRLVFQNNFQKEFLGDTKLTIKKIDNQYRFFIDEYFVHTFEYNEWESNVFGAFISENELMEEFTIAVKAYTLEE